MTVVFTETWTGATGAAWPGAWSTESRNTIQSNQGQLSAAAFSATSAYAALSPTLADSEVVLSFIPDASVVGQSINLVVTARADAAGTVANAFPPGTGVSVQLTPAGGSSLQKTVSGSTSFVGGGTAQAAWVAGTTYKMRFHLAGTHAQMRWWDASTTEPATWTLDVTDATLPGAAGSLRLGLSGSGSSARLVNLDNLTVDNLSSTTPVGDADSGAGADALAVTVSSGSTVAPHTHAIGDLQTTGTANGSDFLRGDAAWSVPATQAHNHAEADIVASGTRDATTFLRGDNTWAVPPAGSGGGSVTGMGTVATLADLKALSITGVNTGDCRFLQGYWSAGDGGGGVFRFVSGDAAAATDAMVVAPNGGGGRWRRVFEGGKVSVKWFGARGDGINDDQARLQAGIAYTKTLSPGSGGWFIGGTLYFPDGTYMLGSRLVLPRSGISPMTNVVRLEGASRMATVLKAMPAFPANTAMIEWEQVSRQAYMNDIRNFTLDVSNATADVKCIWHRQVGAIDTTDPSQGTASVAAEWFNLTLDNLLVYCVTSRHTSMFRFENGNRYAELKNILFDPSFGDFGNADLEKDSLLFDVVSQFGSPPRYTAESEDSVGFFKCHLADINSGLIQGGRSRIWSGRIYESIIENAFCNGGQDNPQFEFIDCFRITVRACGCEGAGSKQVRLFKVRSSMFQLLGVSPGDPRYHRYWAASTTFGSGRQIAPTGHQNAAGPNRYLYSVGTSGATGTVEPNWNSAPNPGNTVTDNAGVVYTNTGAYVVQDMMSLEECYDNDFTGKYSSSGTPSAPQRQTLLLTIDSLSARNTFRNWMANLGGVALENQVSIAAAPGNMNVIEGWDNTQGHVTGGYYKLGQERTERVTSPGDASITLSSATEQMVRFSTNLSANRTVSVPTSSQVTKPFTIVKTATGGAGTLNILGLTTLGAAEKAYVKVSNDGGGYFVSEKGTLP